MKFGICNELFEGWKHPHLFAAAAELGFDAVEIAPFTVGKDVTKVAKTQRMQVKMEAKAAGVKIAGIHWVLASPDGLHISHPDAAIRDRTRQYLLALVEFCADLGGEIIVFGSPKQRNILEGVKPGNAWDYARQVFRACAERGQELGVTFCLEPLSRDQTNFVNTTAEAMKVVDEIDHPNFRLILDCFSMSREETSLPHTIRAAEGYLAHFHANDDDRREPGSGSLDFAAILSALNDIEYDSYVSIEVFQFDKDPKAQAARGLQHLKGCLIGSSVGADLRVRPPGDRAAGGTTQRSSPTKTDQAQRSLI